jgi:hypothetical protein
MRLLLGSSAGMVSLYTQPRVTAFDYLKSEERLRGVGHQIGTVSERTIAEQQSVCIQSSPREFPEFINILCLPKSQGVLSASYSGTSGHVPEFFAILDGVKKTN